MAQPKDPGTLPLSKLHARPSASADAARRAQIARELAMTPRERVLRALELGVAAKKS
ncbi:MAG TPA: hypothetical protein VLC09_14495 [Polyangiaceae bacterium]|nr:hypothetical protein [Polyangiaceae bacterium]